MKAYVLAAGYGTRLGELTRDVAKPLLRVGGAPVLSHVVDRLATLADVDEVVVVVNHRFFPQFQKWADGYRAGKPPPIRIVDDGTTSAADRLGATLDLAFALDRAPPGQNPFVVSAADFVPLFDVAPLAATFRARRRPLLVLRRLEKEEGPGRHNEVTLGEGGRVVMLREKPPEKNRTGVAAIALYFFTPRVAELLSRYLEAGGETDAPGYFVAWLVEQIPVDGAFIEGEWLDVGDPEGIEEARTRLAD